MQCWDSQMPNLYYSIVTGFVKSAQLGGCSSVWGQVAGLSPDLLEAITQDGGTD